MSVSVASKNLYELLGNDPPEDDTPTKPPREVIKNVTSSRKREEKIVSHDAGSGAGNRGGRGGQRYTGNDAAYHDRGAGRDSNRNKDTADAQSGDNYRGAGRGARSRRGRDFDRHSGTGRDEHEKQAAYGWGGTKDGTSEWNDELAGQALALKDATGADPADPNAVTEGDAEAAAAAATAEEEERTKTYDEYLAELATRQASLGPPAAVRRPNEGTRENKKWANAKPLEKTEGGEDYFAGDFKDKTRNRERKTKNLLDLDPRYIESRGDRRGGDRGGRGGRGRGDRGGDRGPLRGGPSRGGYRGDRGDRGDRSGPHGGNNHQGSNVNINDADSFPALGA